ncbi:aldehyde dehydrogenase family protein [Tropicimonas marinistellae]|uniref:aldehyde dehydrogenase family protein n=1 Tax=Tropicimonas marinistellae TaxID=1739787 RepID=UPI00082ECE39|nr:aldehyde dehydrogenase family protein [Tropicimonas marinistellae]
MSIQNIFDSMDYGPAPESDAEAQAWLESHGRAFGHFIGGKFTQASEGFESLNPATGALLANVTQATEADIAAAVEAARAAQPAWAALGGHARARYLYALARLLQKHARLLAVLESLDNGKPIRESRDIDVPLAQRHFYYHAGMAQLMEAELPDRAPIGICGQIIPWNFPLLMLAWKVAPAIATGNTVVLKPAEFTPLTALLFGKICQEAGLPAGVVNIVTGDGNVGRLVARAEVDKIAFTGSTGVGRDIRKATAGTGKALTLELGGKSPYIVFEDADLDSAVEGLVDAIWFNQGQVCCAGSRLLVQEGIAETFYGKLKERMAALRVGDPLDKSIDVGSLVDPVQLDTVTRMVEAGAGAGSLYQPPLEMPEGCYYPPTLITDLAPSDMLMQEEIFGPVLVSTTFRTPAEAVALANNTRYGLAASVWSENVNLALDVAPKLAAGVIWVNSTNLFDAAAGFGGVRESGFGREGGWEGLLAYTRPAKPAPRAAATAPGAAPDAAAPDAPLDRTAKMYVGGKQARPDGGYSRAIWSPKGALLGHVGEGNRKDLRNAVEAAGKATGWAGATGHLRAQILYFIAENLSARTGEFAARLDGMTGTDAGKAEVEAAIDLLFTHAAWADKFDGAAKGVPLRGLALAVNRPVGVIGALCPPDRPLLGLVAAMAPAIAMGNRVVLIPSEPYPLAATDFYQVLETSDLPAGVVNIVTGAQEVLGTELATHLDVDAVWNFSDPSFDTAIETAASGNLKRTWCAGLDTAGSGREALAHATEIHTIWVPYGD